jgi:hypothetical protein
MPRQSKAIGPHALVGESSTTPSVPANTARAENKSAAVRQALDAHPDLMPKQIAEMLNAEGWDVKAQLVSVVKSKRKAQEQGQPQKSVRSAAKKRGPWPRTATTTGAATRAASPAGKAPAISFDSLKKAKELAAQLGGVSQAQQALAALSDLLD